MNQARLCPLCSTTESETLLQVQLWVLCGCKQCTMVYLQNMMDYAEQTRDYDWSYTFVAESARRDRERSLDRRLTKLKSRLRRDSSKIKLRHVLRYASTGELLDVGCGDGGFLSAATRYFNVTGIEISPILAAKATESLPNAKIVCAPTIEADLPENNFDIVTMFSYLEHEQNPVLALRCVSKLIKQTGILIIKCPNYASLLRRIKGLHWCGYRFPDHCNYFTPKTLSLMLSRAGFTPVRGSILNCLPTNDNMYFAARKRDTISE